MSFSIRGHTGDKIRNIKLLREIFERERGEVKLIFQSVIILT